MHHFMPEVRAKYADLAGSIDAKFILEFCILN